VDEHRSAEDVAVLAKVALEDGDLRAFADLLDPEVTWGAPGDRSPACRNRDQVLAWCQRDRDAGARAGVTEVSVHGDRIVVGLSLAGTAAADAAGGAVDRWQVLTVRRGKLVDIRGYERRGDALARARVPTAST
jgi:ketosteroid isomerase-like protein